MLVLHDTRIMITDSNEVGSSVDRGDDVV